MLWAYNSLKWQSICRNELEDGMEHKTLDEIRDVADIQPSWLGGRPLTKITEDSTRFLCAGFAYLLVNDVWVYDRVFPPIDL